MRKNKFLVTIFLILVAFMFLSCLDSVEFDPDSSYNAIVTGDINMTDVTSAVLMITNRSKTVDITNVTITQPEWTPPERSPWAQAPSISFSNKPKRLERKAQYLSPSDKSYKIVIDYKFDAYENSPAGTGTKTLVIPLPLPKQIVELFVYRDTNGVTIIDKEVTDPSPGDIGNPPPTDPSLGEGSSPAVIPPESRDRMATFVVINKTNSQIIDSVNFKMGTAGYAMGKIGVTDKQSIALGQGTWETTVKYTMNETSVVTIGPKNSVIVPSNDPQSVREHYLYFYKTKRGDYNISQEWPPYPNDADEEDMLPPDINGKGRGLIKIVNNSYPIVKLVTILNLRNTSINPMTLYYPEFNPPVPIQYSKTGYVNVVGTNQFPIDAHEDYLIQVTLEGSESLATVERKAYIKDQVVTLIINPEDLKESNAVGAVVTIQNSVSSFPVRITSLVVRNKTSAKSSVYGIHTWQPTGVIDRNNSAKQYVLSSAGMPILKNDLFEAVITVQCNNKTDIITKDFSPATLYSELPPEQNTRTINITDSDIPDSLKENFVPVTSIVCNQKMNVDLKNGNVVSGGRLNLNSYAVVNPSNATVKNPITWEIVNSGDAELDSSSWDQTNGLIDITGRTTPPSGNSDTVIKVKATIKNAIGTVFSKTDFTQDITIQVHFNEQPTKTDVWANSIKFTAGDVTIKVGEYRNLSSMLTIDPSDTTVSIDDINWTIVGGSGGTGAYFDLNGPNVTGKAIGNGTVKVVLPASKNNGKELSANINVEVISDIGKTPDPDDGRILPPSQTGDTENWVEIARNGNYSLIVRARYINIYAGKKNNPAWNCTPFGANNAYGNSIVRKNINAWFTGNSNVENLPSGARLRRFTVKNNAIDILGTSNSAVGLTDGFSKPTDTRIQDGDDVAFALSYGEAANFCSKTYFMRNPFKAEQSSSAIAISNYNKINIPSGDLYGMWLRSPGDINYTAAAMSNNNDNGRVFQFNLTSDREHGLVYPAVWVHQDIFNP